MPTPYDDDVSEWLRDQAELLRLKGFAELDLDRLVAELQVHVDGMSHRLWSGLVPLLTDLLVWAYRPDRQAKPRAKRINDHRAALRELLWASPRLRLERPEAVARVASLCWVVQKGSLKAERSMPDGNKGLAANGQPEG